MLTNRGPVKLSKDGGDMVIFMRPSDKFSSSILDGLQYANFTVRESSQDAVAIV